MKNIPDFITYVLRKPIKYVMPGSTTSDLLDEVVLHAPNGKVLGLTLKLRDLIQESQTDKATKFVNIFKGAELQQQIEDAKSKGVVEQEKTDYSKVDFVKPDEAYTTCEKAVKDMVDSGISLEKYSEIFKRLLGEGYGKINDKAITGLFIDMMSDYDYLNLMGLYNYCFLE